MALIYKDRVKETTDTSGFGSITLGGAVAGFQPFSVIGNGNTCVYFIEDANGAAWEVGIGLYVGGGNQLSRDIVLDNSNGDTNPIILSAGTHTVFVTNAANGINNAQLPVLVGSGTAVTGQIGFNDVLDISADAARSWTLPATAKVTDRVAVSVSTDAPAYNATTPNELKIYAAGATDVINGTRGYHSAGTEWTRLLIAGEVLEFTCIATSPLTWQVSNDGRIPCVAHRNASSSSSTADSIPDAQFTFIDQWAETNVTDNALLYDSDADGAGHDGYVIRRTGNYRINLAFALDSAPDQVRCIVRTYKNGSGYTNIARGFIHIVQMF